MKIVAYQIVESDDMILVDIANYTVERQDKDGNIMWRELFLDKRLTLDYVEQLITEGQIYGAVM